MAAFSTRRRFRMLARRGAVPAVALALLAACLAEKPSAVVPEAPAGSAAAGTRGAIVTVPALTGADSDARLAGSPEEPDRPLAIEWAITPEPQATEVSPLAPVTVAVSHGTLIAVTMTNPEGRLVNGELAVDRLSWRSTEELGYGRWYTVESLAVNAAGAEVSNSYAFRTLTPDDRTRASVFPTDGMTVGVGQPIRIRFDEPIADKVAVEEMISVTTDPAGVEGAFYWLSDREVRWRPREYWPPGTGVNVAVMIYGRDLGDGIYGLADRTFNFRIGTSKIAVIDDATHTMTIYLDGELARTMPVSLGEDRFPTYNGIHIVAERYEKKVMDSSTWGLTGPEAYRVEVEYATRISNSGEFVHAAPWSVADQGVRNVSHGCVNVSTADAKWFHDTFGHGDIVEIRGTKGPQLQIWDGFGDWQVPWEVYSQGGQRGA